MCILLVHPVYNKLRTQTEVIIASSQHNPECCVKELGNCTGAATKI
jgi:hypothetical protein